MWSEFAAIQDSYGPFQTKDFGAKTAKSTSCSQYGFLECNIQNLNPRTLFSSRCRSQKSCRCCMLCHSNVVTGWTFAPFECFELAFSNRLAVWAGWKDSFEASLLDSAVRPARSWVFLEAGLGLNLAVWSMRSVVSWEIRLLTSFRLAFSQLRLGSCCEMFDLAQLFCRCFLIWVTQNGFLYSVDFS